MIDVTEIFEIIEKNWQKSKLSHGYLIGRLIIEGYLGKDEDCEVIDTLIEKMLAMTEESK